ncbi:unnamed protein product [Lymnaea stagnalis]|uniref:Centrosomal protein POC5 n=1 Tax=Lymnaea stagnalis TaxID=6523 RepID=A0AAV2IJA3_LYMST
MSQGDQDASVNSDSRNSPPLLPPESPGSSVSSRLQEEYSELLKYAVGMQGPDLRSQKPLDDERVFQPITSIRSNGSSTRQTPVNEQQGSQPWRHDGETADDVNTNSIYPSQHVDGLNSSDSIHEFSGDDLNANRRRKTSITSKACKTAKYGPIVQQSVTDMSCKLDCWLGKLKSDILAEISKTTMQATQCVSKLHKKEKQELMAEKEYLQREINKLTEMVNTCEKSMCRKDTLIENLTQALCREKEKVAKAQAFYTCLAKATSGKREKFTEKLATNYRDRQLLQKVLKSWFSLVQQRWKQRIERLCDMKAQSVCTELSADYEGKIRCLNSHIATLEEKIRVLQCDREQYGQQVKKAFMRGVCALNMEAMSAFGAEETPRSGFGGSSDTSFNNISLNNNLESQQPAKEVQAPKSLPADVTTMPPSDLYATVAQVHSMPTFSSGYAQKTKSSAGSKGRPLTAPVSRQTGKSSGLPGQGISLAPPMASIVVERHNPITKQTVGKATAMRYPKQTSKDDALKKQGAGPSFLSKSQPSSFSGSANFKPLAGQSALSSATSIKVVD